jgi:hypothetical protein
VHSAKGQNAAFDGYLLNTRLCIVFSNKRYNILFYLHINVYCTRVQAIAALALIINPYIL